MHRLHHRIFVVAGLTGALAGGAIASLSGDDTAKQRGMLLERACLEPPFARAQRPSRVSARIMNRSGGPFRNVDVALEVPEGVACIEKLRVVEDWPHDTIREISWDVVAAKPLNGMCRITLQTAGKTIGSESVKVLWHDALAVHPAEYVPRPDPVDTGRTIVCAVHCPLWKGGASWKPIVPFPDREPVLGWYDEGTGEVTDWEIKWALDHGISSFLVCWYRAKGNEDRAVEPALNHWVDDGLSASRYGGMMRFALIYENANQAFAGRTSEKDLLENLVPFWIEKYFRRPNYLAIDNKPVLAIYDVAKLVGELGGDAEATRVLGKVRQACRDAGFKDIVLLGHYCWGKPANLDLNEQAQRVQRIGLDASWSYHWPTFSGLIETKKPSEATIIEAQQQLWKTLPQPNVLTVSVGWDSAPWGFSCTRTQWQLSPEEFKRLCQKAKGLMASRKGDGIADRLLLIDNWNEYGEGHYIFPTRQHGFAYLDAVRATFAPDAPDHVDLVPEDIARGPHDEAFRREALGE